MAIDSKRVQAVFLAAVEAAEPAARAAILDKECATGAELRQRVEALLRANDDPDSMLDGVPASLESPPVTEQPGTVIGPYKLVQQIGEGGMGIVYMAERSDPVRQIVAIKIIKPGMDSRQVIARFEAERQALAMMDHPNIAKVFDAGSTTRRASGPACSDDVNNLPAKATSEDACATETGRLFFVMELVKGVPITKYCDDNQLTLKERLELFIPVCQAVMHAHQKGIIHRDLKPSNVLVACYDDKPVPKVIDFGVAKATGQKLTERTLFTQFGQLVGTLEYMSPEQATLNALDVDTRSDIYSLGVLLYELLSGSTPFEKNRFKETAFDEVLRIIREEEPPTPSKRLSRSRLPSGTSAPREAVSPIGDHPHAADAPSPARQAGPTLESIAAQRKTEPAKLSRLVRGDLDWIVMKALDKDRNRRYETASAFGADVERYLKDEAVEACPPSAGYRLRKFVRRHRVALLVSMVVIVSVVALLGSIGWVIRDGQARHAERRRQVQDAIGDARALLKENQPALARQRLNLATEVIANDRAALAGLAVEVDSFGSSLDRYLQFQDLIEQGKRPRPPKDRRSEFSFLFQALACYQVLEREDWLTPLLEQSDLGQDQVEQIRRTVYEKLLWIAHCAVLMQSDLEAGRYDSPPAVAGRALAYLRAAEKARVPTHGLYELRAQCHEALGNRQAASVDNELARQTAPTIAMDYYHRGDTAFHAGNKAEALKWFSAAATVEPTHFWSLYTLGDSHFLLGGGSEDCEAAVTAYTGCIMKRPDFQPAYVRRAAANMVLERYQFAVTDCTKAIELSSSEMAWAYRGKAYEKLGQWDNAIADYSQAITLDPWTPLVSLADQYAKLGQWQNGVAHLAKVVDRNPKWIYGLMRLGDFHSKLGEWPKAITDYSDAIKADPKPAPALIQRANAYKKLQQWDKAILDQTALIKLFPKESEPRINRGNTYAVAGQWNDAIADYTEALTLNPKLTPAWNHRALAYAKLGKKDAAPADSTKVLDLLNKNPAGLNQLAWQLATDEDVRFRDPRRAAELAKKAVELEPKVATYWNTLGVTQYGAAEFQASLDALNKAMKFTNGGNGWDWFFVAMAKWQLGQKDEAHKEYNRAVQWMDVKAPNNAQLRRFRAEAAKLLGVKE